MLPLSDRSSWRWDGTPVVARLTADPSRPEPYRRQEIMLVGEDAGHAARGFLAYLVFGRAPRHGDFHDGSPLLVLSDEMRYLEEGDVLYVEPSTGRVSVLYRRRSGSNTIVLTERCNCRCIMCPQPPSEQQSDWTPVWLDAIRLMSPDTEVLGISGGEPTMLPDELVAILALCRDCLPRTEIEVLSNGRMFNYMSFCRKIREVNHAGLVFGIPLYSDLAYHHDYIVQTEGAFDQTVRGLMNLARCGQRTEIRVVLMRPNVDRLPDLARFIARNLPFAEHVALMGLEPMGYAAVNWRSLWAEPAEYQSSLIAAVEEFSMHQMNVSIYNIPFCMLDRSLWPLAKRSISDWKREFYEQCERCAVRNACGGVFASFRSRSRTPLPPEPPL